MVYKCNENTAGPRIMPTLFVITSKDSCLYQLANGKIGFIICYALFCLKLRNLSNNHWGLNCIMQPFQQMTYRCVLIETIHKTHFLVKKARYVQRQWALVYVKMGHYSVCVHIHFWKVTIVTKSYLPLGREYNGSEKREN